MNTTTDYDRYIMDSTQAIALQLKADRLAGSVEWKEAVKGLKLRKMNTAENRAKVFSIMLNRMN